MICNRGNVVSVRGKKEVRRHIKDMVDGEVGFTVPWAYDEKENMLNVNYDIEKESYGTLTLKVQYIDQGEYIIEYT